jgi:hypothetical protein
MSKVAIVGGTGHLGSALAFHLVRAGHDVAIGSRKPAAAAAPGGNVTFGSNRQVAEGAEFIIVTVPYAAQAATLSEIKGVAGKAIVIDATVPLVPPRVMRVQLPAAGCAALEARQHLGPDIRLVSAFHNVAAHRLAAGDSIDCDVLVFSDDVEARKQVIALIGTMGLRALAGGALANSAAAEALTSILIFMNKTYSADGAGVRFTGLEAAK